MKIRNDYAESQKIAKITIPVRVYKIKIIDMDFLDC
jgi:hypothetical protein